jgi:hypothetical protein
VLCASAALDKQRYSAHFMTSRFETMALTQSCPTLANRPAGLGAARLALALTALLMVGSAAAQEGNTHYWHAGTMAPGAIGQLQLQRGGPLPGYYQPVEILTPPGVEVALANAGQFAATEAAPLKAGLLVGAIYRLRVANLPGRVGQEVYPTIEMINRLYPPAGQELRFAMPIELTQEDLELAVQGQFVTRVIYLEDPRNTTPSRSLPDSQNWFDIGPGRDALAVADALGRPMAILRMGGRVPDEQEMISSNFLSGSPPWLRFREPAPSAAVMPLSPEALPAPMTVPGMIPSPAPQTMPLRSPAPPAEKQT